jgi:hypothetical protein
MKTELLRFNGAVERDPAFDAWRNKHAGELGALAHQWFEVMRNCEDESGSMMAIPVGMSGRCALRYASIFKSHLNVGFFHSAALPDPARLLQGPASSCAM